MHPKATGLIAAGSYYAAVTGTPYQQGFILQFTVNEALYGYKKSIQV
jgi:hypothetical protein